MRLLLCFILLVHSRFARAEPFLKPNDVVALVGGEDMVVVCELGYLETLIQRALPDHRLKFRSLAWEGDTVFEQRRDLNYPTLEAQLDKIGATAVIAQFGQMESLGGADALPSFLTGYEKLVKRLQAGGKRRVALVAPTQWMPSKTRLAISPPPSGQGQYIAAVDELAEKLACRGVPAVSDFLPASHLGSRDGVHLAMELHGVFASTIAAEMLDERPSGDYAQLGGEKRPSVELEKLRELVRAKNRLWYHYSRPQNWAFLAGDRTNQPSSRDHKDMSKRWFPDELEQFVPLIDAKEKELWEAAAKFKR